MGVPWQTHGSPLGDRWKAYLRPMDHNWESAGDGGTGTKSDLRPTLSSLVTLREQQGNAFPTLQFETHVSELGVPREHYKPLSLIDVPMGGLQIHGSPNKALQAGTVNLYKVPWETRGNVMNP